MRAVEGGAAKLIGAGKGMESPRARSAPRVAHRGVAARLRLGARCWVSRQELEAVALRRDRAIGFHPLPQVTRHSNGGGCVSPSLVHHRVAAAQSLFLEIV